MGDSFSSIRDDEEIEASKRGDEYQKKIQAERCKMAEKKLKSLTPQDFVELADGLDSATFEIMRSVTQTTRAGFSAIEKLKTITKRLSYKS